MISINLQKTVLPHWYLPETLHNIHCILELATSLREVFQPELELLLVESAYYRVIQ